MAATNLFSTDQFCVPRYGGGSFADIPELLRWFLVGGAAPALRPNGWEQLGRQYDRVIVLFVDAFGWRFFEQFQDHPLLRRFIERGSVTQLTSQFPSTTSAHVTTLYTGQPVGRHGVYEWFYYEPALDAVIAPLLFSFAGDSQRETLIATGIGAEYLLPAPDFIADLLEQGVNVTAFQPREFARSTYSTRLMTGAAIRPNLTLAEALVNVRLQVTGSQGKVCSVLYFGDIDSVGHVHGPAAPQMAAEIDAFLTIVERWLCREIDGKVADTLLMLFADHGQVGMDPRTTIYLNRSRIYGQLEPLLQRGRGGRIIAPAGGPRDFFLHVRDEGLDEAQTLLGSFLAGRAEVVATEALIDAGYFGPGPVADVFRRRVGNLVVLPYAGESVYWYEKDRFEQKHYGHHGGLTRAEMEIPLGLVVV